MCDVMLFVYVVTMCAFVLSHKNDSCSRRHICCCLSAVILLCVLFVFFFFQAEDGIRDLVRSRGLGDVYKRQVSLNEPAVGSDLEITCVFGNDSSCGCVFIEIGFMRECR